jgi:hypothetical protein
MELDDTRTDYEQAVALISGATMMQPEMRHLIALHEAMQEHHEVTLIKIANALVSLKEDILNDKF